MTIRVWGCSVRGIADAALFVGVMVGVGVLAGFVRAVGQQPPTPSPFFSNDQAGLLKILVVLVLPIVGGIGAWVWKLSHTQEKQDLDKIGGKINGLDQRAGAVEARISGLEVRMGEDRLAAQAQLFEAQRGLMAQMAAITTSLTRVEGKVCDTADMRDALIEGMRAAMREREK